MNTMLHLKLSKVYVELLKWYKNTDISYKIQNI